MKNEIKILKHADQFGGLSFISFLLPRILVESVRVLDLFVGRIQIYIYIYFLYSEG